MSIEQNKIVIAIVATTVIVGGVVYYATSQPSSLSQAELFEIKRNCAEEAEKFAIERSTSESFSSEWKVLRSDYNQKKQSCFGEFDELVIRADGSSFSEYWIYDLLTGEYVDGYTYLNSTDSVGGEEWTLEYISKAKPKYEKISKDIFGSVYLDNLLD